MFLRRRLRRIDHQIDYREERCRQERDILAASGNAAQRAHHIPLLRRFENEIWDLRLTGDELLRQAVNLPAAYWQARSQAPLSKCASFEHRGYQTRFCPECCEREAASPQNQTSSTSP